MAYAQVTVEYKKEGGAMIPIRVHTVLISTQHNEDVSNEQIHKVRRPATLSAVQCCGVQPLRTAGLCGHPDAMVP